jgi:hypothetical protein
MVFYQIEARHNSAVLVLRLARAHEEMAAQIAASEAALAASRALLARLDGKPANDIWSWSRASSARPSPPEFP